MPEMWEGNSETSNVGKY